MKEVTEMEQPVEPKKRTISQATADIQALFFLTQNKAITKEDCFTRMNDLLVEIDFPKITMEHFLVHFTAAGQKPVPAKPVKKKSNKEPKEAPAEELTCTCGPGDGCDICGGNVPESTCACGPNEACSKCREHDRTAPVEEVADETTKDTAAPAETTEVPEVPE